MVLLLREEKTVVQVLPIRTVPVGQAQPAWPARRKRQARP